MSSVEEEIRKVYREGEDQTVAWLLGFVERAERAITDGVERVVELEARLEALEVRGAAATSQNSSKPPSQDPFRNTAKRKRRRRRRGERHHSGGRALLPASEVDEFRDVYPTSCKGCGLPLTSESQLAGAPGRWQQVEIPEPAATVTEWRTHACKCGGCGVTTRALAPAGAGESFGPRLRATIATLSADKRQTTRQLVELLRDCYGVTISVGQVAAVTQRVGALLEPAAAELREGVLAGDACHADETSWRVANKRAWLWGLFNADSAYYEIRSSRGGAVAERLVPISYRGVAHTDCYSAYSHLAAGNRQLCWAHLARHFTALAESDDEVARAFGERGLMISDRVFKLSREAGESSARRRARIVADVDALVAVGLTSESTRTMATTLAKHRGSLWHCLERVDVDATNNHAERLIRPAVIKRKLSFGSGSARGARATAALLSVVTTARLRGASPFAFVEEAVRAAQAGSVLPLLA
jgi:transposase